MVDDEQTLRARLGAGSVDTATQVVGSFYSSDPANYMGAARRVEEITVGPSRVEKELRGVGPRPERTLRCFTDGNVVTLKSKPTVRPFRSFVRSSPRPFLPVPVPGWLRVGSLACWFVRLPVASPVLSIVVVVVVRVGRARACAVC